MKIDVSALDNALSQLKMSIRYLRSDLAKEDPNLRIQFRNSAIQCFEFTYELSYKMVLRQLGQIVSNPDELRKMNFPDFVRTAADAGLIPEVKRFLRYREMRNITSHTYNQKKAEEIVSILDDFIADVEFILNELKHRNDAKTIP